MQFFTKYLLNNSNKSRRIKKVSERLGGLILFNHGNRQADTVRGILLSVEI